MKQLSGQMDIFSLDMPYGRTYPAHSVPTKERTSASSSKSSVKSQTKEPLFLDLRKGDGGIEGVSWATGIPSRGGCSTLVFGECPSVAEESGLWQILEANVPQKYYLSAKACAGVLRRAERRGKELPEILETALKQQIERWEKYGTPLPKFCDMSEKNAHVMSWCFDGEQITSPLHKERNEQNICHTLGRHGCGRVYCVYDARGNGDGETVPTITGDHENRITDYTSVVCETLGFNHFNGSKSRSNAETINGTPTLRGGSPTSVVIALDRAAFNQGQNAKYDFDVDESGTAQTVVARGPGAVCYCLQGNGIDRADTAGCNGKGVKENECYTLNTVDRHAICYGFHPKNSATASMNMSEEFSPTLEVNKEAGVCYCIGNGQVAQLSLSKEARSLDCMHDKQAVLLGTPPIYIVRRLTPLECCRLQGMPDEWCADVPHSDAQEYRMWGNGMALPNALYIMEGFEECREERSDADV